MSGWKPVHGGLLECSVPTLATLWLLCLQEGWPAARGTAAANAVKQYRLGYAGGTEIDLWLQSLSMDCRFNDWGWVVAVSGTS